MARAIQDRDDEDGAVLGHVIPRRRLTRWAYYYVLLYLCLPVLLLGLLTDVLLYAVFTGLFGRCFALFCLIVYRP